MRQAVHLLDIQTKGKGLIEITEEVSAGVAEQKIATDRAAPK
jgi:thiamine phosphate synthase YjbQ (UPF0047 family)